MVARREISSGHARAILKLRTEGEQKELAQRILKDGWTVRQAEGYTPSAGGGKAPKAQAEPDAPVDPNVKAAITEMERALGTRVRITEKGAGKGKIEIEYYSSEDLDRIYTLISAQA
jgi:ParB family chromosome partitioning protein